MSDVNASSPFRFDGTDRAIIYEDFPSFMRAVVLPRRAARPDDLRLDGARSGGNWDVAGVFQHHGKTWKVHADTHYKPLELAYESAEAGQDPFVEEQTRRGTCLVVSAELKRRFPFRYKYLYIYETRTAE